MTRWGLLLLAAYVVYGLLRGGRTASVRPVVWLTVVVLMYAALKVGAL